MSLRVPSIRPDDYDPLAALCKAAGDSLRLNVLRALANDSFGVLELAQIFAIGQSGMSHHLKVLAQAGLVATRREGNAIFYRRSLPLAERTGGALHAALLEEVDERALPDDVRARIDAVHAQRAAVSQDFFARAADKFQAQQDLIAGLPQYRERVGLARRTGLRPRRHGAGGRPGTAGSCRNSPGVSARSRRWTTARRCWNWRASAARKKDWATSAWNWPMPCRMPPNRPIAWC